MHGVYGSGVVPSGARVDNKQDQNGLEPEVTIDINVPIFFSIYLFFDPQEVIDCVGSSNKRFDIPYEFLLIQN